jgi:hypothetical protein
VGDPALRLKVRSSVRVRGSPTVNGHRRVRASRKRRAHLEVRECARLRLYSRREAATSSQPAPSVNVSWPRACSAHSVSLSLKRRRMHSTSVSAYERSGGGLSRRSAARPTRSRATARPAVLAMTSGPEDRAFCSALLPRIATGFGHNGPVSATKMADSRSECWRRGWDSNPGSLRSTVFKTAAIDRSATSPRWVHAQIMRERDRLMLPDVARHRLVWGQKWGQALTRRTDGPGFASFCAIRDSWTSRRSS